MENLRSKVVHALLIVLGVVLVARLALVLLGPVLPSLIGLLALSIVFWMLVRRK